MTEKELVTHLILLDYYKIEKHHKDFLAHSKANSINHWIDLGKELIKRYSELEQKKYLKGKMDWLNKTNKELYLIGYKKSDKWKSL